MKPWSIHPDEVIPPDQGVRHGQGLFGRQQDVGVTRGEFPQFDVAFDPRGCRRLPAFQARIFSVAMVKVQTTKNTRRKMIFFGCRSSQFLRFGRCHPWAMLRHGPVL